MSILKNVLGTQSKCLKGKSLLCFTMQLTIAVVKKMQMKYFKWRSCCSCSEQTFLEACELWQFFCIQLVINRAHNWLCCSFDVVIPTLFYNQCKFLQVLNKTLEQRECPLLQLYKIYSTQFSCIDKAQFDTT